MGAYAHRSMQKWMPDAFALDEEGNRISAGDAIIRELVVNSLIHREYTSPILQELLLTQMAFIPTMRAALCTQVQ